MNPLPHLVIESGCDAGRSLYLASKSVTIGRARRNDVRLHDPMVSRHHCCLAFLNGIWTVTDLGSANETLVNEESVHERSLVAGDRIMLGDTVLRIEQTGPPVPSLPNRRTRLAFAAAAAALLALAALWLLHAPEPETPPTLPPPALQRPAGPVLPGAPSAVQAVEPLRGAEPPGPEPQPAHSDSMAESAAPLEPLEPDVFAEAAEPEKAGAPGDLDLLQRLRRVQVEETARLAAEHAARIRQWAEAYAAELTALQKDVQTEGDYEATTAVDRERKRFRRTGALADYDIVHVPPRLAALQRQAIQRHAELLRMDARAKQTLDTLYRQHLSALRADLTRKGKLDDAARVNRELQRTDPLPAPAPIPFL
jgi:hypothetical protein